MHMHREVKQNWKWPSPIFFKWPRLVSFFFSEKINSEVINLKVVSHEAIYMQPVQGNIQDEIHPQLNGQIFSIWMRDT